MNPYILIGKILQRFKDVGFSQVEGYNTFGYIRETNTSVIVSRENGEDTIIPFEKIKIAVEAFHSNKDLYYLGPSELRKSTQISHITSPIWSLLHLLESEEYS